jgi:hypothetical protein
LRGQGFAALVFHRLRAAQPARGEVRHQAEKERQVAFGDPLFIQRQDEIARTCVQQEIGILDALGDALVGQEFADLVLAQEFPKLIGGDVGVNRHVASRFSKFACPRGTL